MCSFDSNVQGAQSRNTAPNSTHCSSSHELDEVLKTLRMIALAALTRTAIRMAHATSAPSRVLNLSMARLKPKSVFKQSSPSPIGADVAAFSVSSRFA
jgi:hypothetical protein